MPVLATYSRYFSKEEAEEFGSILQKEGIYFEVESEKNILDKIYVGETPDPMFALKINADDFERANSVSKAVAASQLNEINPDYYLFTFTNQELKDVLDHPDQWNAFDQVLAAKLLRERNVHFEPSVLIEDVASAYKPARLGPIWLIMEYLVSIYFLYGGLAIGLATLFAFKTLPNGKKVKLFDENIRLHGKIMLAIGIIWILILLRMNSSFFNTVANEIIQF